MHAWGAGKQRAGGVLQLTWAFASIESSFFSDLPHNLSPTPLHSANWRSGKHTAILCFSVLTAGSSGASFPSDSAAGFRDVQGVGVGSWGGLEQTVHQIYLNPDTCKDPETRTTFCFCQLASQPASNQRKLTLAGWAGYNGNFGRAQARSTTRLITNCQAQSCSRPQ